MVMKMAAESEVFSTCFPQGMLPEIWQRRERRNWSAFFIHAGSGRQPLSSEIWICRQACLSPQTEFNAPALGILEGR